MGPHSSAALPATSHNHAGDFFQPCRHSWVRLVFMKSTPKPFRLVLDGILVLAGVLFVRFASGAPEDPSFLSDYVYGGNDLGAVYAPGATTLKLWAPTARNVTACLFD